MSLEPGTHFGPYEILGLLGKGGMGEVYRARDTRLGRDVAIKVLVTKLAIDPESEHRFGREARALAALAHPNVVPVFDVGVEGTMHYVVTELVEGETLRQRLATGALPPPEAADVGAQIADGLAAAHAKGLVHRDIKPENIVLADGRARILDFGIARRLEPAVPQALGDRTTASMTDVRTIVGTPGYMSPEQVRGQAVDARSDIFALGALLFEMLTARRAFVGASTIETIDAVLRDDPDLSAKEVPPSFAPILKRCLAKDREARFGSAAALAQDLRGAVAWDATVTTRRRVARGGVQRRWVMGTAVAAVALGLLGWVALRQWKADYFWRNPLANAQFRPLTDSEEAKHSATISRDGKLVAFLSSRDGPVDIWFTQVGSGDPMNATRGRLPGIVFNGGLRMLNFSPDAAFVALWLGASDKLKRKQIDTWSVPTLSGEPHLFRARLVEPDWSPDERRLVYHQTTTGDPTLVETEDGEARQIYVAPGADKAAKHAHFPTWSPDGSFIYFVQGDIPNPRGPEDIWRIRPTGGSPERITFHNSRVTHPTFIDRSTLLYVATTPDGNGPWIYGLDVERRVPHRLSSDVAQYSSLAASGDGRRLVATTAQRRTSLWRVPLAMRPAEASEASRIKLPTAQGHSPRLAADYLLYVSSNGATDRVWKVAGGTPTELWTATGARIIGGPAISPSGDRIAFSTDDGARKRLVVMNADGTGRRILAHSMEFRGAPEWSPDGQAIVTAVDDGVRPRLFRISLETGAAVRMMDDYALDPAWAPGGAFMAYSGMDIGTTFPVKAVTAAGLPHPLPELTLNRGARRFRFLPGQTALVVSRGDMEHKNLWVKDLTTGAERQLTNFGSEFVINDFDVSPDGANIVFERLQESSDIVLIERPEP